MYQRAPYTFLLLSFYFAACVKDEPIELAFDTYGGIKNIAFESTGFFRVERQGQRAWLVTPDGHAFFSAGVNAVGPKSSYAPAEERYPYGETVTEKYENEEAWADVTAERLKSWGVNTLGAWSQHELFLGKIPYAPNLKLADADWLTGETADYFSSAWEDHVRTQVETIVTPLVDDPYVVGYFTDNELRWTRDWRVLEDELFDDYMALDKTAAGKTALMDFLRERYDDDIGVLNQTWDAALESFAALEDLDKAPAGDKDALLIDKRAFLKVVARRYFSFTSQAIKAVDPNHLNMGCRFVSALSALEVVEAAGEYLDVMSVNNYVFKEGVTDITEDLFGPLVESTDFLQKFAGAAKLPILVSEYGFRAADSGLPNTYPLIYPTYDTQTDRADAFESYAREGFAKPYVVGLHWFRFVDQPATGRFDGEDNNFGLVDITDEPYDIVTTRMRMTFDALYVEAVKSDK